MRTSIPRGLNKICRLSSKAGSEAKARETKRSKAGGSGFSVIRCRGILRNLIPLRPSAFATYLRNTIFLGSRSRSVTSRGSSTIFTIKPGKPAPVPTSRTLSLRPLGITLKTVRESKKWRTAMCTGSLRAVRLTFSPHSKRRAMWRIILETASGVNSIPRTRAPWLIISAGSGGGQRRIIYPFQVSR